MADDNFTVEVLDDGSFKVTVDGKVSAANHLLADKFMAFLASSVGSTPIKTKLSETHQHAGQKEVVKR